jgi:hypothetical protein
MKYPQGYIFLNETAKLPSLPTIQAWFGGRTGIYIRGVSKPSRVLNDRIAMLENVHRYAMKKSDHQMQCVVFFGTAVSELFLIAQTHDLIKVYWIDSADQAKKIKQLTSHIFSAMELEHHIIDVRETYSSLANYIYSKTGQTLTGDADIERFFSGRDWGTTTEAEVHIRQIAKNETRAGLLRRFDLENELETAT